MPTAFLFFSSISEEWFVAFLSFLVTEDSSWGPSR